jgi:predicted metalloendopeptidase
MKFTPYLVFRPHSTLFCQNNTLKNYRQDYVDYTTRMAENIRQIFITRVETNDWLSPKTMKYAIEKLKAIKLVIAAPSQLREDPLTGL